MKRVANKGYVKIKGKDVPSTKAVIDGKPRKILDLSETPLKDAEELINHFLEMHAKRKGSYYSDHPIHGHDLDWVDRLENHIVISWKVVKDKEPYGVDFPFGVLYAGHWIDFHKVPKTLDDFPKIHFSDNDILKWKAHIMADISMNGMKEEVKKIEHQMKTDQDKITALNKDLVKAYIAMQERTLLLESMNQKMMDFGNTMLKQIKNLQTLVPGMYKEIKVENNELHAISRDIEIKESRSKRIVKLGNYDIVIPFYRYTEITIKPTATTVYSSANRAYYHPHVSTDGHPCWGDANATIKKLRVEYNFMEILVFLSEFLKSYNSNNPYEKLERWIGQDVVCPVCNGRGNTELYLFYCQACYDNTKWCEYCEEVRVPRDAHYCANCIEHNVICSSCKEYICDSTGLCAICQEKFEKCRTCGKFFDIDAVEYYRNVSYCKDCIAQAKHNDSFKISITATPAVVMDEAGNPTKSQLTVRVGDQARNPIAANVLVDGISAGLTDLNGRMLIVNIPAGKHAIEAVHSDISMETYSSGAVTVTIEKIAAKNGEEIASGKKTPVAELEAKKGAEGVEWDEEEVEELEE